MDGSALDGVKKSGDLAIVNGLAGGLEDAGYEILGGFLAGEGGEGIGGNVLHVW